MNLPKILHIWSGYPEIASEFYSLVNSSMKSRLNLTQLWRKKKRKKICVWMSFIEFGQKRGKTNERPSFLNLLQFQFLCTDDDEKLWNSSIYIGKFLPRVQCCILFVYFTTKKFQIRFFKTEFGPCKTIFFITNIKILLKTIKRHCSMEI